MNRRLAGWRRLAYMLARVAVWLLPASRGEWGQAMLAELYYVENERQAAFWALGCVMTSIKERVKSMAKGHSMEPRKAAMYNVAISIVFAVVIVLSSYLFKGTRHDGAMMPLLIALWVIPYSWLSTRCKRPPLSLNG